MMSKSEIMRLVAMGRAHECFTHEDAGTYDVTLMRKAALAGLYPGFTSELLPEHVEHIKRSRDWEKARVLALTDKQMQDPSLWVHLPDDTHLLIDGTHRLLARATAGYTDFRGFMAPWDKIIRPSNLSFTLKHDWGKVEVREDGKLYHRATGKPFKTEPSP